MKANIILAVYIYTLASILTSCSTRINLVQRHYNSGFYAEFTNTNNSQVRKHSLVSNNTTSHKQYSLPVLETNSDQKESTNNLLASATSEVNYIPTSFNKKRLLNYNSEKRNETKLSFCFSEKKTKNSFNLLKKKTIDDEETDKIILALIAFFLPFLAVGMVTDWQLDKVLLCVLLCFLFYLPGIIYAFIVLYQHGKLPTIK